MGLQSSWEAYATDLANAPTDEALVEAYNKLGKSLKISMDSAANVVFARDTRMSGSTLVAALVAGLESIGVKYIDGKLLTTPQLHYLVRCENTKGTQYAYGEPTEKGYYEKLSEAYKVAIGSKAPNGILTVDCANGVGGPKLRELIKYLPELSSKGALEIKVVNDEVHKPDMLNVQVRRPSSLNETRLTLLVVWCRLCQNTAACSSIFQGWSWRQVCLIRWRRRSHRILFQ